MNTKNDIEKMLRQMHGSPACTCNNAANPETHGAYSVQVTIPDRVKKPMFFCVALLEKRSGGRLAVFCNARYFTLDHLAGITRCKAFVKWPSFVMAVVRRKKRRPILVLSTASASEIFTGNHDDEHELIFINYPL